MFSRFRSVALAIVVCGSLIAHARELRVCADPDNLPFSNDAQQGFENRIAKLIATDLHASLIYVWQRMGRGFVRDYLNSGKCDLLIGVPVGFRPVLTTVPYYRSSYVFVTRKDSRLRLASLNDPALHGLKIGVQALDEDYTPAATALARRGMQNEIVGFDSAGDDAESIMKAVAGGMVDTAIVWGPLAGYFAKQHAGTVRLQLTPVVPEVDPPNLPFTFSISMGVQKQNTQLKSELNVFIERREGEIHKILNHYGIPQLELAPATKVGQ